MIGLIFGFNADWCHASSLTGANEPASVPLPEHRHHKKLCFQDTGEQIREYKWVLVRMHQSKCSVSSLLIHLRYHSDESRSLHLISGTNQRPIFPQQVFHPPAKSHKEERMPKTWSKYLVSCWYFQVQEKKRKRASQQDKSRVTIVDSGVSGNPSTTKSCRWSPGKPHLTTLCCSQSLGSVFN